MRSIEMWSAKVELILLFSASHCNEIRKKTPKTVEQKQFQMKYYLFQKPEAHQMLE